MNRERVLETVTYEEIEELARKCGKKLVDRRRFEEYWGREEILRQINEEYGGIAYSGDTFRLYQDGVWKEADDLFIQKRIQQQLEMYWRAGYDNPNVQWEKNLLQGIKAKMYREPDVWNSNPHILVFKNTAYDTDAMKPVEHSPDHMATVGLPYDYDPEAAAPVWDRVIHDLLTQDEREFLQEFAGYCLTTSVKHQMALWLVGPRGYGKSTLIRGLETMLGSLGSLMGSLGLGQLQGVGARFALAGVPGKTLLTCTENPTDRIKATDILNALITGDTIQVERKNKDLFDYRNTAKLLWAMNSLPGLYDANNGLFRRVHILRIDKPPKSKDPNVIEQVSTEGAGIVNWALEGLARLNQRGHFEYPESVQGATKDFVYQNDLFGQFLDEWTHRPVQGQPYEPENYTIGSTELTENFNRWLEHNWFQARYTTKSTKEHWERHGLTHKRTNRGSVFIGARLNSEAAYAA